MSIENFKNPWAAGGSLHPDWVGGEKVLGGVIETLSNNQIHTDELKLTKIVSDKLNIDGEVKKSVHEQGLYLFTALTIEPERIITASVFRTKYQTIAENVNFSINGIKQNIRQLGDVIDVSKNTVLLKKALKVVTIDEINKFIKDAVQFVGKKRQSSDGFPDLIKAQYFGHGGLYDWKYQQGKDFYYTYIHNLGVFETNHFGNVIYGRIASILGQTLHRTLYYGDCYQKNL